MPAPCLSPIIEIPIRIAGHSVVLSAFILCCAVFLSGCTVLGFGVGQIVDRAQDRWYDCRGAEDLAMVGPADTVYLQLKDGTGRYGAYDQRSAFLPPSEGGVVQKQILKSILLRSNAGESLTPVDSVAFIRVLAAEKRHSNWLRLTVAGLLIDVAIVTIYLTTPLQFHAR
jgi:hypothetical protein